MTCSTSSSGTGAGADLLHRRSAVINLFLDFSFGHRIASAHKTGLRFSAESAGFGDGFDGGDQGYLN